MQTIYFGAPGTGKSNTIDTQIVKSVADEYVFRVTFYPDFTYSDFIGQLLPQVETRPDGTENITYKFSKGVFTKALEKAYEDVSKDVYLIVEEMSRGDCAAIFGDVFQLLDREKNGLNKGYSKYFINNEMIAKDIHALSGTKVKLPPKFHILGTVNTSDQNVFVMDTAFKRRFEWEYVSPDPVEDTHNPGTFLNNPDIEVIDARSTRTVQWIDMYEKLNLFIADDQYLGLGEDKQLGPFFIEFDMSDSDIRKRQIKNKLLHYLWNDIQKASYKVEIKLFDKNIGTFRELYNKYTNDEKIFSDDFLALL